MYQGYAINELVEIFGFKVIPMLIDLVVAFWYFWILFDVYMAAIIGFTTVIYLCTIPKLTEKKVALRRPYTKAYRKQWQLLNDAVQNWHTVSVSILSIA